MKMNGKMYGKMLAGLVLTLAFAGFAWSAAQSGDKYTARLAPAPPLAPLARTAVAGLGSATATLSGKKLTISGTFELKPAPTTAASTPAQVAAAAAAANATAANLCLGLVKGARGEGCGAKPRSKNDFDLMISPGNTGTLSGSADLTTEQVEALKKGRYYIQIHSMGAPTGHLLGWLLPPDK